MRHATWAMVLCALALTAAPARADLSAEVNQAVGVLERLPDGAIPPEVLEKAHGLVIVDVFQLGVVFGLSAGQGVLVARTPSGWSPPVGIGFGSLGLGLQVGVAASEYVFVLKTPEAVEAFTKGNFDLGIDATAAFFPWGRSAGGAILPHAAVGAVGRSQGLYLGLSVDGGYLAVREKDNASAYGGPVSALSILKGEVEAPPEAAALNEALSGL